MKRMNRIEMACERVPGFLELYQKMERKVKLSDLSRSLLVSYSSQLAKIALHFEMLPTDVSAEEIEEYLYQIGQRPKGFSNSYFKFAVYGLRFAYKIQGERDKHIALPSIKQNRRLPVVLSKQEVKRMFDVTTSQKHRVLVGLLYGCGLRSFEARNVKVSDLDFDRKVLHVRQGKNKKDRYVPLSEILISEIKAYLKSARPKTWIFAGKFSDKKAGECETRYAQRSVLWVIEHICKKAEIIKEVTVHTLRHTFATHLLEDGLDIVTIKNVLGHEKIETTMIYLHVAKCGRGQAFSPLDTLFGLREPEFKHGICPYYVNSVKKDLEAKALEIPEFSAN